MNDQSINQAELSQYVQGFEDIKQCWQNILFTVPGAIPLLPEFGCDLFRYIDKPITESFGKVRNIIIAALERWEPRAKIDKVTRIIDGSNLLVNIEGTQVNTGLPVSAQINITSSAATQLLTNETTNPVIAIGGTEHDRLHEIDSIYDHASVDAPDRGKVVVTDGAGRLNFTNEIDGGEV